MKRFFVMTLIVLGLGAVHLGGAGGCGDSSTGGGGTTGGGTTGGDGGEGGECGDLCEGAGFESGTETDFGGGLVECQCNGDGDVVQQDDCTAYCADFGVGASDSIVTVEGDKCVCDGTSL